MPSDSKVKFLADQFLDYLQELGFGYPMVEADMSVLQDGGHVARLVLSGTPDIFERVRQAVFLNAKNWKLRTEDIDELVSHRHNKQNSLWHEFSIAASPDWSMGLYFELAQWAKANGAPFWLLVHTTAGSVRQILEEAGWECIVQARGDSQYVSQIELQTDAPTVKTEKIVSQLLNELEENLNWLRDRTRT
jgi:hypothetical protein